MAQVNMSYNKAVNPATAADMDSKPAVMASTTAVKTEAKPYSDDKKAVAAAVVGSKPPHTANLSLHVGDLSPDTKEQDLYDFFGVSLVKSIRVCRDAQTGSSLCYGYVNFNEHEDAEKSMEEKNFLTLKGRPIRITWAQKSPPYRQSNKGNLFIKNVQKMVDSRTLYDAFKTFGTILSFKIATDENGHSKGYGFIHYAEEDVAKLVIEKLNGLDYRGKKLAVGPFISKSERPPSDSATEYKNLYFKGYLDIMTQDEMFKELSKYGTITSHFFSSKEKGQLEGYGFAAFDTHENAVYAEKQIGSTVYKDDKRITITRALSKRERVKQVEDSRRQRRQARYQHNKNLNLYVKHLDLGMTDQAFNDLFSRFGPITSAVVMRNPQGQSLGYGFVCFANPDSAEKAIEHFRKPNADGFNLYINYAELKEDREKMIRERFNKININDGVPQTTMAFQNAIPMQYVQQNLPMMDPKFGNYPMRMPQNVGPNFMDKPSRQMGGAQMGAPGMFPPQQYYGHQSQVGSESGNRNMNMYEQRRNYPQSNGQGYKSYQQNHDMSGSAMYQNQNGGMRMPGQHQNNRQGGHMQNIRKNQGPNQSYRNNVNGQYNPKHQQQYGGQYQPQQFSQSEAAAAAAVAPSTDMPKSTAASSSTSSTSEQNSTKLFAKLQQLSPSESSDKIGYVVSMIAKSYPDGILDFINDESKLKLASSQILEMLAKNSPSS